MRRSALTIGLALAGLCAAATSQAQDRRWEVEIYAGAAARTASDGRQTLPPAGAPIVTTSPLFPSRDVPSWFFGDGASLLNAVNQEFGGPARLAPLDSLFARVDSGATAVAGARLRRALSTRTWLEVGVDFLGSTRIAPGDLEGVVDATRRSFGETFNDLLRSGPFTSLGAQASSETSNASRREFAVTAAFNSDLGAVGPLTPYLTLGAGVVAGTGTEPMAQLTGRYRFSVLGQVPIDEIDRVTVRFDRRHAFAAVLGGGVRKNLTDRWTVRLDARALIGPDTTRVRVTADPSITLGTPAGFVESFTNPAIQFSNDPALGRRSTLSDTSFDRVVFDGGIQARTLITFGITRRF